MCADYRTFQYINSGHGDECTGRYIENYTGQQAAMTFMILWNNTDRYLLPATPSVQ